MGRGEVTQFRTVEGCLYFACVVDLCSRKVTDADLAAFGGQVPKLVQLLRARAGPTRQVPRRGSLIGR